VYTVPYSSRPELAQHGLELLNLRVLSQGVPYTTIAHRENQCEFAVVARGCNLERPRVRWLEDLRTRRRFCGNSQRPPFPHPMPACSEPEECTQERGHASIQRDNVAHRLIPQRDVKVAAGEDDVLR
jgi:hypothetical protein